MELSDRLRAVAELVTPHLIIADVGTDHGYVPIYLVQNEICPKAIAMDVNQGPLERAEMHIRAYHLESKIQTRLSDGLKELRQGEADAVILAGMGGGLMIRILESSKEVVNAMKECILQPQTELYRVREYLLKEGFDFLEEKMILEEGKYYPMMKIRPPRETKETEERNAQVRLWSKAELTYGKLLIQQKNPVLMEYLQREHSAKKRILMQLHSQATAAAAERISELEQEQQLIEDTIRNIR